MSRFEKSLSGSERLEKIGEILLEAIIESGVVEAAECSSEEEADLTTIPSTDWPRVGSDNHTGKVINYLKRVGEASPAQVRTMLGMPRTSAYRVMNRLTESGLIVSDGQTRAVVYRLNALPPHHQNVEGN